LLAVQALVDGLALGGVYSLVSIGLTLIYGTLDIVNFAHGDFMMIGMYVAYMLNVAVGFDPLQSLFICTSVLFVIGLAVERGLIHYILDAPPASQIFVTFGLLIALESVALIIWGPDYRVIRTSYSLADVRIGAISISAPRAISFVISLMFSGLLYLFLAKTYLGRAIRAVSQHREGAMLVGVDIHQTYMVAFGLGLACVGIAGALVSSFFYIYPDAGLAYTLVAFVVCVLGGMGSFIGALIGGLIIGVTESLTGFFILPAIKELGSFTVFILILLFKPTGLFGRSIRE